MKLADVSIKRPVFATVMVGVLAVFGVWAYPKIAIDMYPEVEFPIVTVTAVYPGADPETIESRVVDKLEEAISTVNGIKVMRSTSMENVGLVFVQFELERKADQAVQDVRDKVSGALKNLPKDLEPPIVERVDINAAPIMSLALAGPMEKRDLTALAKDVVKQQLQALNGVGGVDIIGGQEREFHVWIDPQRLESYGLAVGDVAQALVAQNVEIPGGRLDVGKNELSIKTRGQVFSARELGNIIITAAGGSPVRIADVARVEDGAEEHRSYATLNGKSSVTLLVRKQSEANTVDVSHKVQQALDKLRPRLPKDVTIAIPNNSAVFTENMINDVKFDLVYGAVLAILILVLGAPYLRLDQAIEKRPILAYFLDSSQSMSLPAGPFTNESELAALASALDRDSDSEIVCRTRYNERNLWDAQAHVFLPHNRDGSESWSDFSPDQVPVDVQADRNIDYTEGNPMQYAWFAPQDVDWLIASNDGSEIFVERLNDYFSESVSETESSRSSKSYSWCTCRRRSARRTRRTSLRNVSCRS